MVNYNSRQRFNQLSTVRYNDSITQEAEQLISRLGPRPIVLSQDRQALAILENSFNIILEQTQNSVDEITFSLPHPDSKQEFLENENLVQMFDTLYIIREVVVNHNATMPYVEVMAQALWYDLAFADRLTRVSWSTETAHTIFSELLRGTGWRLGRVEIPNRRSLELDPETTNVLDGVTRARSVFGARLQWNTNTMVLNVLQPNTIHSGAAIVYGKNVKDVEVYYDTKDLITRLYVYGAESMGIEEANNGVPFLENYSFTDKRRVRSIRDERFTNPFALREFAEAQLEVWSRPRITYRLTAAVLSNLSGLEHEQFSIGSIVRVHDSVIGVDVNIPIMSWRYDVIQPENTVLELETRISGLSDLLSEADLGDQGFAIDRALRNEMLEMSVFNHLKNSRGDDGYAHWSTSGWAVDTQHGFTGTASFRAQGDFNQTKRLSQTVYPAHRSNFALSFRAHARNIVLGSNGRVGVNVRIRYRDGSTDEQFIPLIEGQL